MLDNNGFIDKGDIFFNDPDLTVTAVAENSYTKPLIARYEAKLNEMSRAELGAATWREILALEKDHKERLSLNEAEAEVFAAEWRELVYRRTEANNQKQALDRKREKAGIKAHRGGDKGHRSPHEGLRPPPRGRHSRAQAENPGRHGLPEGV